MLGWLGRGLGGLFFMGLIWCSQVKCLWVGLYMYKYFGYFLSYIIDNQVCVFYLRIVCVYSQLWCCGEIVLFCG